MSSATTEELAPTGSSKNHHQRIHDTLKCPICLCLFTNPVLLDCSHSLCLECARSLALHDGGTNTAEVTCPLCKQKTVVMGGDQAKELEDALITSALQRFDVHPPRKGRVRIEDLKACYEGFAKNGLHLPSEEPKPTALHLWRAVVAKMESQTQKMLGKRSKANGDSRDEHSTDSLGDRDGEATDGDTSTDPMMKLRFKPNILLNNLVASLREEQVETGTLPVLSTVPVLIPAQPPVAEIAPADATLLSDPSAVAASSGHADLPVAAAADDGVAPTVADVKVESSDAMDVDDPESVAQRQDAMDDGLDISLSEEQLAAQGEAAAMMNASSPIPKKPPTPVPGGQASDTGAETGEFDDQREEGELGEDQEDDSAHEVAELRSPSVERSAQPPQGSRHLWVANLGANATEDRLRETFTAFGPVESARILRRSTLSIVGFVHFSKVEDALTAKQRLDGTYLGYGGHAPHPCKIQYQQRGKEAPCPTLRVHNISPQVTETELRSVFEKYGKVRVASINKRTNIGFVAYDTTEEAASAISALHDTELRGQHVFMDFSSKDRGGDRDRGRGDDRGRGPPLGRGGRPMDRDRDRRGPPRGAGGRITLAGPRDRPPFEVHPEDIDKLRELVDVLQYHLPPHQRQTLEDAMLNNELFDNVTALVARSRGDIDGVIRDVRRELKVPPAADGYGRGGPPFVEGRDPGPPRRGSYRDAPSDRGEPYSGRGGRGGRGGGYPRHGPPPMDDYGRGPPPRSEPGGYGDRGGSRLGGRSPGRLEADRGYKGDGDRAYHRGEPDRERRYGGEDRAAWDVPPPPRAGRSPPPGPRGSATTPPGRGKRSRSGPREGRADSRGRSRSPPSRRRRWDGPGGRDAYPPVPPPADTSRWGGHAPPPAPPLPPPTHVRGPPPAPHGAPLEAECEQFIQAVMGKASPPAAGYHGASGRGAEGPPPVAHGRSVWLTSSEAARYPCYEGVLQLIKNLLNPYYRDQAINKDDFKRIAEDTTLRLVQQLLDAKMESRPDVPAHYQNVASDMIRASIPPRY